MMAAFELPAVAASMTRARRLSPVVGFTRAARRIRVRQSAELITAETGPVDVMTLVCARPVDNWPRRIRMRRQGTPSGHAGEARRQPRDVRRMVVDPFVAEGVSGSLASRPGPDELRAFASRNDTIVVRASIGLGVQPKICSIR